MRGFCHSHFFAMARIVNGIVRLIEDYFKVKDERDDKSPGGKYVHFVVGSMCKIASSSAFTLCS